MKKMLLAFTSLLLFVPLMMGMSASDTSKDNRVDIVLHKIAFPDGEMPADSENTGRADDDHASLLKEYHGLNNVKFEVFDVSRKFYELRNSGMSAEQAQQELAKLGPNKVRVAEGTTHRASEGEQRYTVADVQDGLLVFSLAAKSAQAKGQDAVYLIHEASAPKYINTVSKDLVVVLPVYDGDAVLNPIHLYPKNERNQTIPPRFNKVVTDGKANYNFGDKIPFTVTTTVPDDLTDYKYFKITDQADDVLHFNPESLKVTIDGKEVSFLYEKTVREHGFELNFKDIDQLSDYEGKTIVITYTDTLMSHEKVDAKIVNTASLDTDFDKITKEVDVKTGGKKFVKVDMADNTKLLAGAEFVVLNEQKQYLVQSKDGFAWEDSRDASNLVKLVSNKEGAFEITGLAYGKYQLQEITAPDGYQLNQSPVEFVISETSYDMADGVLKVVNKATETPPNKPDKPNKPNVPDTNKPNTKHHFPKTNEILNNKMVWLGAIMILIVIIVFVRNKKEKNEE